MRLLSKYIKLFSLLLTISLFGLCQSCKEEDNEENDQKSTQEQQIEKQLPSNLNQPNRVQIGAEVLMEENLAMIEGKCIGIDGNQTSRFFNGSRLLDTGIVR